MVVAKPGPRLQWLDALRGVAVLAVVAEHLTYLVFTEVRHTVIVPWFDIGKYGVMVFFLVSGYIIPASLERHGSVRRFWTSRFLRLYPLLIVAVACLLVLSAAGATPGVVTRLNRDPVTMVVAHATLLQDVLGVWNVLGVLWTLTYEMLFYLLVTALFIGGLHRRSAGITLGLGLGALLLAPILPAVVLSHDALSTRWVVGIVAVLLAGGLVCASSRRDGPRRLGGLLVGGLAVLLILTNQRAGMWEGLIILATMFSGTTIYRAEKGQVGRGRALAVLATVWVLAIVSGVRSFHLWPHVYGAVERDYQHSWTVAIVATGVTFAVAWLLRHRRFPRPLVWFGLTSYSIYLMHTVLLSVFHRVFDDHQATFGIAAQGAIAVGYLVLLAALAWLTYHCVELPGQRLGRRLSASRPQPAPPPTGELTPAG